MTCQSAVARNRRHSLLGLASPLPSDCTPLPQSDVEEGQAWAAQDDPRCRRAASGIQHGESGGRSKCLALRSPSTSTALHCTAQKRDFIHLCIQLHSLKASSAVIVAVIKQQPPIPPPPLHIFLHLGKAHGSALPARVLAALENLAVPGSPCVTSCRQAAVTGVFRRCTDFLISNPPIPIFHTGLCI